MARNISSTRARAWRVIKIDAHLLCVRFEAIEETTSLLDGTAQNYHNNKALVYFTSSTLVNPAASLNQENNSHRGCVSSLPPRKSCIIHTHVHFGKRNIARDISGRKYAISHPITKIVLNANSGYSRIFEQPNKRKGSLADFFPRGSFRAAPTTSPPHAPPTTKPAVGARPLRHDSFFPQISRRLK